jgi:hypothetical protein
MSDNGYVKVALTEADIECIISALEVLDAPDVPKQSIEELIAYLRDRLWSD